MKHLLVLCLTLFSASAYSQIPSFKCDVKDLVGKPVHIEFDRMIKQVKMKLSFTNVTFSQCEVDYTKIYCFEPGGLEYWTNHRISMERKMISGRDTLIVRAGGTRGDDNADSDILNNQYCYLP